MLNLGVSALVDLICYGAYQSLVLDVENTTHNNGFLSNVLI